MTKTTNSLLFRFGINTLWKNKSLKNQTIINIIQLENIVYKELKKKNLKVLFMQYKHNIINIFVYNYLNKNKSLKYQILTYFNLVWNLQKVIEKFGISKNIVVWFLKSKKKSKNLKIFLKKKKKLILI